MIVDIVCKISEALEVFKANADLLGKKKAKKTENNENIEETAGFTFSKPKKCDAFAIRPAMWIVEK